MELVAPAGSLAALKSAIEAGADTVYLGLKNATNARNFAGLNFTENDIRAGVELAHARGRQVLFAINTFVQAGRGEEWRAAVDAAHSLGADAVIMADAGLLGYASDRYPDLRLHLSVQGSATHADAIELMKEQFGIKRVVLPRVLTLAEIARICGQVSVEVEVFGFGSLCVMAEGRCLLSSYATGDSPTTRASVRPRTRALGGGQGPHGRAPERHPDRPLRAGRASRLSDAVQGSLQGRWRRRPRAGGTHQPERHRPLAPAGRDGRVRRQDRRAAAQPAYVTQVVSTLRAALDSAHADAARFSPRPEWNAMLARHAEGSQVTQGAFERPWK